MNEQQLRKLYRRIERASKLNRNTFRLRLSALFSILF